MARRAISTAEQKVAGAPDPDLARSQVAASYGNLGQVYQTLGDCAAAREASGKALAQWSAVASGGGKILNSAERTRTEQLLQGCAK